MGRAPCCAKVGLRRGPWTQREDMLLKSYIQAHGEGDWKYLPRKAGLLRCGKSCRLRWRNYLRPDIKRGNITADEEDLIIRLHSLLGNRWSLIAGRLPGRTDNEIKNYWNSRLRKKLNKFSISNLKNPPTLHSVNTDPIKPPNIRTHYPKPERATPFSLPCNSVGPVGSPATHAHEAQCRCVELKLTDGSNGSDFVVPNGGSCDDRVLDVRCCDGYGFVVDKCGQDLVDGSDFVYESTFVPTIDLEMIYGELSQLLNL